MTGQPLNDDDAGNAIENTKRLNATRQIQVAIMHFRKDEFERATAFAVAAEETLPPTKDSHILSLLRNSLGFKEEDYKLFINWLKRPLEPDNTLISEFEAVIAIVRAISKIVAIYGSSSEDLREFGR